MRRKEKSLIEKIEKEEYKLVVIYGLKYWDNCRKVYRPDAPCCEIEIYRNFSDALSTYWAQGYSYPPYGFDEPKDKPLLLGTIEVAAYDMVFKDQGIRIKSCSEELRQYETTIEDVLDAADFMKCLCDATHNTDFYHYALVLEREAKKQRRGGPTWDEYNGY